MPGGASGSGDGGGDGGGGSGAGGGGERMRYVLSARITSWMRTPRIIVEPREMTVPSQCDAVGWEGMIGSDEKRVRTSEPKKMSPWQKKAERESVQMSHAAKVHGMMNAHTMSIGTRSREWSMHRHIRKPISAIPKTHTTTIASIRLHRVGSQRELRLSITAVSCMSIIRAFDTSQWMRSASNPNENAMTAVQMSRMVLRNLRCTAGASVPTVPCGMLLIGPIIGETRYRSDDLAYRAFLPPRITTFGPSDVDDTGVSMPMGSTLVVMTVFEASGRTFGGVLRAEMGVSRWSKSAFSCEVLDPRKLDDERETRRAPELGKSQQE